jgi:hypothetical protein
MQSSFLLPSTRPPPPSPPFLRAPRRPCQAACPRSQAPPVGRQRRDKRCTLAQAGPANVTLRWPVFQLDWANCTSQILASFFVFMLRLCLYITPEQRLQTCGHCQQAADLRGSESIVTLVRVVRIESNPLCSFVQPKPTEWEKAMERTLDGLAPPTKCNGYGQALSTKAKVSQEEPAL